MKIKFLILLILIVSGLLLTNSGVLAKVIDSEDWPWWLWWLAPDFPESPAQGQSPSTAIQDLAKQDEAYLKASGLGREQPATIVSELVKIILGFLGVIFIVLIIYSGFTWMTSAGNEEKISKAKRTLAAAVIGLTIVLAGYIITYFVIDVMLEATGAARHGLD